MSKHTPGPWNWHRQGDANEFYLLANEKRWVISFRQNGEAWSAEQEANANVIAAATELLHMLYTALPFVEDAVNDAGYKPNYVKQTITQIKAVLAKAEGGAA